MAHDTQGAAPRGGGKGGKEGGSHTFDATHRTAGSLAPIHHLFPLFSASSGEMSALHVPRYPAILGNWVRKGDKSGVSDRNPYGAMHSGHHLYPPFSPSPPTHLLWQKCHCRMSVIISFYTPIGLGINQQIVILF